MLTRYLSWIYNISPSWTKTNLLSVLNKKNTDSRNAFWCGFLARAHITHELMPELKPALYELAVDSEFERSGFENNIAALILLDWENNRQKDCMPDIDRELKELLLQTGEHLATVFLRTIESWCNNSDRKKVWIPFSITFLNEVWPRQKCMRTPRISAQLFELIFSNTVLFDNLHSIILPKLSTVERGNGLYLSRRDPEKEIIRSRPFDALQVFYKILPTDAHNWPYDMGAIIHDLLNADKDIKYKPEMIELKRKWDSL